MNKLNKDYLFGSFCRMSTASASGVAPSHFDMKQCPYDPAHIIEKGTRLQSHLKKCRRDKMNDTKSPYHQNALRIKICPFSVLHHIHEDKMEEHKKTCDKKPRLDYVSQDLANAEVPAWRKNDMDNTHRYSDEDWDAEGPVEHSYDPTLKIKSGAGNFLFNPIGKTKSEQRTFRREMRMANSGVVVPHDDFEMESNNLSRKLGGGSSESSNSSSRSSLNQSPAHRMLDLPEDRPRSASPQQGYGRGRGRGKSSQALNTMAADLSTGLDDFQMGLGRGSVGFGRGSNLGRGSRAEGQGANPGPGRGRGLRPPMTSDQVSNPALSAWGVTKKVSPPPGFGKPSPPQSQSMNARGNRNSVPEDKPPPPTSEFPPLK